MNRTTRIRRRMATPAVVAALVVGTVLGVGGTASAAGSGSSYAGPLESEATTTTSGSTYGFSYARHGCILRTAGWTIGYTYAWASCFPTFSYDAYYLLRG